MAEHHLYVIKSTSATDHVDILCQAPDCDYRTPVRSVRADELVAMQHLHRQDEYARVQAAERVQGHRNGCQGCEHEPAAYPPCWTDEQVNVSQQHAARPLRGGRPWL